MFWGLNVPISKLNGEFKLQEIPRLRMIKLNRKTGNRSSLYIHVEGKGNMDTYDKM